MKPGWTTRAIGRHLVDLPANAELYETYTVNQDKLELLPIKTRADFDGIVFTREQQLKKTLHQERKESMFIERVNLPNGSVILISWKPYSENLFFDNYFLIGNKAIKYSGGVDPGKKEVILKLHRELNEEWCELRSGEIPEGVGFVAEDVMLVDKRFNLESWSLVARFPGKPALNFKVNAFTQRVLEPGLRERVSSGLADSALSYLGQVLSGKSTLRNRKRPVGPIEADEILLAATQNGRRGYAFTWEAQGKTRSLAEPNLVVELNDGIHEQTSPPSFKDDDEALALWDAIIDSIRLRPGAAG